MRTDASQGQASGELWKMDLATRRRLRLFPELLVAQYALSQDGRRVVFTTSGLQGGDGIWIADLDQRTAPRQLTKTREQRAFFGAPGTIVFMGDDNRLRRMRDDGSAAEIVSPDPIVFLITVSPDGRWAVVIARSNAEGSGTRVEFRSLRAEEPVIVCDDACRGIGPASVRYNMPFHWTQEGSHLVVNLRFLDEESRRVVFLPYRSDAPFATLWPAGLGTAEAVQANPGARMIDGSSIFPAAEPTAYLTRRQSFQSNLYRIRLPQ